MKNLGAVDANCFPDGYGKENNGLHCQEFDNKKAGKVVRRAYKQNSTNLVMG